MQNILEEANQYLSKREYDKVIVLMDNYLKNSPSDFRAICLRAIAYRNSDMVEKALLEFGTALSFAPNDANIYSEMGVTYFLLKQHKNALEMMEKAVVLEPENPYRYSSRAYIKDACKDVEGAIADYKKAIELDPEDAIAYNNLGMLEEKLGRQQNAKENFAKSDELNGIDWDEFKTRLKSEGSEGGSSLNKSEGKKEVQFITKSTEPESLNTDNSEPQKPTYFSIIKKLFTSKSELKNFFKFIFKGFKH